MKVTCDGCNKAFEPTNKMLIEHRMQGDLIEVYFNCPICKKKHHVCWHNSETKNLQKLIHKAENAKDGEKVAEYRDKLKTAMDKLNNRT